MSSDKRDFSAYSGYSDTQLKALSKDDLVDYMFYLMSRVGIPGVHTNGEIFAYACPAGCGCLWRGNNDGSMSLFNGNQRSCKTCEQSALSDLIALTATCACERPPEGWLCGRAKGHEGPCAATRYYGSREYRVRRYPTGIQLRRSANLSN